MSISFCLIVRNEAKNLEKALRSVEPVADEVIVTDTGSTDDTVETARKFGAKISYFKWCDDFSAARNYNFSQARGDWIFYIDADEEFLPESSDELRRCLSKENVFAWLVLRRDLTDLSRPNLYTEMWLPRLFRNHEDIHFAGRIHEHFQPSLYELAAGRGQIAECSSIRIRHYGYAGTSIKEKLPRGVKLLELELEERPGQLYYQVELYRTLLLAGDNRWQNVLNEAVENLLRFIDDEKSPTPQAALLIETLLQMPENKLPAKITSSQLPEIAQRWFPMSAPLLWVLAKQDYEHNRFESAEAKLRRLIQMGKENSYDKSVGFDPRIIGGEAKLNLAVCLIRQTMLKEATEILESLSKTEEFHLAAEQNLSAIKRIRMGFSPKRPKRR